MRHENIKMLGILVLSTCADIYWRAMWQLKIGGKRAMLHSTRMHSSTENMKAQWCAAHVAHTCSRGLNVWIDGRHKILRLDDPSDSRK